MTLLVEEPPDSLTQARNVESVGVGLRLYGCSQ